jgi:hypothetical protein
MASSKGSNPYSLKAQTLEILEEIHKIGFPNTDNIETLKTRIGELVALCHQLKPSDQLVIKHLVQAVHRIEHRLEEDGDIPVKMYTTFHKHWLLLKSSVTHLH